MAQPASTRVPCLDPALCKVRWHYADTSAACGAVSSASRKPVHVLATPAPPAFYPSTLAVAREAGVGLRLQFTEETWQEFSQAAAMVHGLNVNRHALMDVVERVTSGGTRSTDFDSDPEEALAFEVLCLDPDVRTAVVKATLDAHMASDADVVDQITAELEQALAEVRGADSPNEATPNFDSMPYLRARVAGIVDASFEAQQTQLAYEAMAHDITAQIYEQHPGRVKKKWVVRGSRVHEFGTVEPRSGDLIVNLGVSKGLYDVAVARSKMTADEWAMALSDTKDDDLPISVTTIRRWAKSKRIDIEPYLNEETAGVNLMTAPHAVTPDELAAQQFKADTTTAKAGGRARYQSGRSTFGSHFYIPDVSAMEEERAFATLVSARVRADMRHSESKTISSVLKASLRNIEPIVVNRTLHYNDSQRDFVFQVNSTTSFDRDLFEQHYPEARPSLAKSLRERGEAVPTREAIVATLKKTRGETVDVDALVDTFRKPSRTNFGSEVVAPDGSKARPSALGAASGNERVSRGEAINGRVFTEALSAVAA